MVEISEKKKDKLKKFASKYNENEKLNFASVVRKKIRYIEKNTMNFPNQYYVLKNKIIDSCYGILENIYRANIFQDICDKKNNCQNTIIEFLFRRGIIKRTY